jgi:hypothetical protein
MGNRRHQPGNMVPPQHTVVSIEPAANFITIDQRETGRSYFYAAISPAWLRCSATLPKARIKQVQISTRLTAQAWPLTL